MCLFVDFTGSMIHTSVMCTIHKREGSFISCYRIFAADSLPSITCSAKSRNKFFLYLHFISPQFFLCLIIVPETRNKNIGSNIFVTVHKYFYLFICFLLHFTTNRFIISITSPARSAGSLLRVWAPIPVCPRYSRSAYR